MLARQIKTLKVIWICSWAGIATVVLFFPMVLAALTSTTGNLAFSISKLWAFFMLAITGVHPQIKNKDKINPGKSYIIISNHQSHFDILALVTRLGIQFRWIIKQELRTIPLFGYALYAARNIFIDRSNHAQAMQSIQDGVDRLPPGVGVMFFAEGTRSPDGQIHEFKKGGFVMAVEKGLPILPVSVNGSRKVMPKQSLAFTPGPIEVIVADPIETKGYTHDDLPELMQRTRQVIMDNFRPNYPD